MARRIGVLFGQRTQLWWDLPLEDSFSLLRHVYRVPADRFEANLAVFRELLALDELLPVPVRQLSLGQRMRGELAAVLLHDPAILFLDEPTIGLDPVSKEAVRSFLVELNCTRRTTVLLTTHDLVDVERLCERLVIIDHGKLIEDSTVAAIKQRYGTERTLVVDLEAPGPPLSVDGVRVTKVEGPRQWLRFHRDDVDRGRAPRTGRGPGSGARSVRRGARHRGHRPRHLPRRSVRIGLSRLAMTGEHRVHVYRHRHHHRHHHHHPADTRCLSRSWATLPPSTRTQQPAAARRRGSA